MMYVAILWQVVGCHWSTSKVQRSAFPTELVVRVFTVSCLGVNTAVTCFTTLYYYILVVSRKEDGDSVIERIVDYTGLVYKSCSHSQRIGE